MNRSFSEALKAQALLCAAMFEKPNMDDDHEGLLTLPAYRAIA